MTKSFTMTARIITLKSGRKMAVKVREKQRTPAQSDYSDGAVYGWRRHPLAFSLSLGNSNEQTSLKPLEKKCLRLEGSNFRLGGIAPITRAVPSFRVSMRLAVSVAWQKGN